jgi:hypothetical protein
MIKAMKEQHSADPHDAHGHGHGGGHEGGHDPLAHDAGLDIIKGGVGKLANAAGVAKGAKAFSSTN